MSMKDLIVCLVCFLLCDSLMAENADNTPDKKATAAPAAAPAVQLVLELSDGSHVIGTPSADKLKLKTKYATLEFLLSKSRTIEFIGDDHAARVNLQNGDQLNGALAAKEIALKADAGTVTTPLDKVNKILIRAGSLGGD